MKHDELWPDVVGQDVAKRKLAFLLEGFNATKVLPHLMFIAPKGCGKTTLAKALGRNLNSTEGKPKRFLEINCSTIKNVKQFINNLMIPHVHQQECTVLFDEASELPKDVTMAMLTMFNPNPNNRTEFSYEDYVLDIDFSRQTFMFATTEAHQIFHALMDRCDRIDMEDYSYEDLGEIVLRQFDGVTFEDGVLNDIATVLRGNARAAQKMSINIKSYLAAKGKTEFDFDGWNELKFHLGILPLGLSSIEVRVLAHLRDNNECSLTNIAAATGLTPQCIRQDFEMYLQKQGLMSIDTKGRSITSKGQKLLERGVLEGWCEPTQDEGAVNVSLGEVLDEWEAADKEGAE